MHGSMMPRKLSPGRFARLALISPPLLTSNIFEPDKNARDSKAMTIVLHNHKISTKDCELKGEASRISMSILLSYRRLHRCRMSVGQINALTSRNVSGTSIIHGHLRNGKWDPP